MAVKNRYWISAMCFGFLFSVCPANAQVKTKAEADIQAVFASSEHISGRKDYLATPYNTAGDRLYMVGNQDGSFPPIGWHVTGEMGGIWSHPIKLMDGFSGLISLNGSQIPLVADSFVNYPFGNRHIYTKLPAGLTVDRYQFVPDNLPAVYVQYLFQNRSSKAQSFEFRFVATSNLMPVWLGERSGMTDSRDLAAFDRKADRWIVKDSLNTWFTVYGSTLKSVDQKQVLTYPSLKPNTSVTLTTYRINIPAGGTFRLPFIIAGSSISRNDASKVYDEVQDNALKLLIAKKKRFREIEADTKITLSDKKLEQAFRWIKYNNDWLIIDVPGRGRAISAGLPDYPWWFGGDMAYTLKGLIATGQKKLVYSSIDLIYNISAKTNGNGRIVHEVSTNGAVYNPGNVNETAQFTSLVWDVFCWTGDTVFLRKHFPAINQGLEWLIKENDKDHNLLPDGSGMMEIHGLNSEMIDVAAYTQKAFADAAQMARIFKQDLLVKEYGSFAEAIKQKINKDFWVEDFGSYADFISTKQQALQLADDAIIRADTLNKPWAVAELRATKAKVAGYDSGSRRGFVMHHNWVVNTPMEMGIADSAKALVALNTAKKFTSPFGIFVTGIDRDETAGSDDGSFAAAASKRAFTYTGAVMTLPTGVQVVAENNYGRADEAYALLQKMLGTFSYALPGSIYEVSPDFGMMTQAWNLYAFGEPIIKQLFGIRPMAFNKTINITPLLPSKLATGSIGNVKIGDNILFMSFEQKGNTHKFLIRQSKNNWILRFTQPAGTFKKWYLNGKPIKPVIN